jgi:hypothetical protein
VTPYLAIVFVSLRTAGSLPSRVRAMDMRHLLLLLPFLLDGLLSEEVEEHNKNNPLFKVSDPSSNMVEIVIHLIAWYQLYRRRFPAKDEDDIADMETLGLRYV